MSDTIKPEDIFNRVNESKFMAQDERIRPIEWAKRKVIYYDDEIRRKKERQIPIDESVHLQKIWEAVVQHFAMKNKND